MRKIPCTLLTNASPVKDPVFPFCFGLVVAAPVDRTFYLITDSDDDVGIYIWGWE
jgi:hypothetical protein